MELGARSGYLTVAVVTFACFLFGLIAVFIWSTVNKSGGNQDYDTPDDNSNEVSI